MVVVQHEGVSAAAQQSAALVVCHADRHAAACVRHPVIVTGVPGRRAVHGAGGRWVQPAAPAERFDRLPAEAAGPPAEGPLLEHVLLGRVDGPVVTLPGPTQRLRQLDEALVEGQVVADGVFPALVGTTEKRKLNLKIV